MSENNSPSAEENQELTDLDEAMREKPEATPTWLELRGWLQVLSKEALQAADKGEETETDFLIMVSSEMMTIACKQDPQAFDKFQALLPH